MIMLRCAALLALLVLPPAVFAQEDREEVDVEICLAVDGSGSIDPDEFTLQRQAYAAAITDSRVLEIIRSGYKQSIAIAMMEWGGADSMHPVTTWHRIASKEDADAFAVELLAAPRQAFGWNSISNAIAFCHAWIEENDYRAERMVIDVSADAGQRGGMPLPNARGAALNAGITINALALNYRSGGMTGPFGGPLAEHFRRDVIGGPWSFALEVDEPRGFKEALVKKLVLEIAARLPAARDRKG
ncbi:MAG: DUF1194 domain-containing protein [Minwuia sp.]|uniref:DUF1194 domain-containing protein n=1 Tax=Minwuia sp. TaxID=2493630 RepID=UPI003A897645